jgi:hypothetical protein
VMSNFLLLKDSSDPLINKISDRVFFNLLQYRACISVIPAFIVVMATGPVALCSPTRELQLISFSSQVVDRVPLNCL